MFTRPVDLSDDAIRSSLREHWSIEATDLVYAPVGFGAHHWRAGAAGGDAFLTVHDLAAKRRRPTEGNDEVFARLVGSFSAAAALAAVGLEFVLSPTPTLDARVVDRLDERFSLAVHPYLDGHPAGAEGEFASARDRRAVLDLVIEVHRATDAARAHAGVDDLEVPHREEIGLALDALGQAWDTGPYGERARRLLDAHAPAVRRLLVGYDALREQVAPSFDRAVLTHGEPHASNVLVVDGRLLLIDWDTAVLAPAARDLWDLDPGDGSIVRAYEEATGLEVSRAALDLYRLWYDLAEIGQYLGELRGPHPDTGDMAESWKNLQHFLQPAERWPGLAG